MKALLKRPWARIALLGLTMVALCAALRGFPLTVLTLCDGLSLAAMAYMIVAAWRFVMRQGSFASLKYGMLKLPELIRTRDYRRSQTKLPSMGDYMATYHYDKPSRPYLIAAVAAGACALAVWQLWGG